MLKPGFMSGLFSIRTQSWRKDAPKPNRFFLAHILVVVRVQHGCPPMPELVGRLQRIMVDFVVCRGEGFPSPILDPLDTSHLGHSPAYAE